MPSPKLQFKENQSVFIQPTWFEVCMLENPKLSSLFIGINLQMNVGELVYVSVFAEADGITLVALFRLSVKRYA